MSVAIFSYRFPFMVMRLALWFLVSLMADAELEVVEHFNPLAARGIARQDRKRRRIGENDPISEPLGPRVVVALCSDDEGRYGKAFAKPAVPCRSMLELLRRPFPDGRRSPCAGAADLSSGCNYILGIAVVHSWAYVWPDGWPETCGPAPSTLCDELVTSALRHERAKANKKK